MILSLNWLKKFTDIDFPIDKLTTLIGARLVEIEKVIDYGAKYQDVVVAKVVECAPLPDTDHLNVTKIDDAKVTKNVERDENGLVTVVCGAPNVRVGLMVAWLPPGATVPSTLGDIEPFVLSAKDLRGTVSNGMLASAKELDLFDDHTGILELDDSAKIGTTLAEVYELNDYLLDIENKSLTHRPDTFGVVGFAREVAGISGVPFITPDFLKQDTITTTTGETTIKTLTVTIDDPALSDRYQAVVLSDARAGSQAPLQVQTYLARSGVRPISGIVDITNLLMLSSGQPLHAFDYDKLIALNDGKADIHVRAGRGDGDTLKLLDGRTITLAHEDIVIANGETAVALAGAMGGKATEIDENTKNIIIESATFNLYNLRATQMRHGIFSEAITRFTKGQPAELTTPVLAEAVRLAGEWMGAKPVSEIVEAYPDRIEPIKLTVETGVVNAVLGSSFTTDEIVKTLQNVEFVVDPNGDSLSITVPYWRADIHIAEDIIEEVGRLNGFDTITLTLPTRDFIAVMPSSFDKFTSSIRSSLVRAGASEVLTYSFVHGDLLEKAGQAPAKSYQIVNSISPDLQYFRQTLTPSLLDKVNQNLRQKFDEFALFEINKIHEKDQMDGEVPAETHHLAMVLAANKKQAAGQTAYYQAKHFLEYLAQQSGIGLQFAPLTESDALTSPFEPKRSASVVADGDTVGVIGEYKRSVESNFKLPDYAAGFEINLDSLFTHQAQKSYHPLSRYPGTDRDICFQVPSDMPYADVVTAVHQALTTDLETTIEPVDIYQPDDGSTKNITIRIKLTSHQKTLTSDEVAAIIDSMTGSVCEKLGATVI